MLLTQFLPLVASYTGMPWSEKKERLKAHLLYVQEMYVRGAIDKRGYFDRTIGTGDISFFFLKHENWNISALYFELLREALSAGYLSATHIDMFFNSSNKTRLPVLECLLTPTTPKHAFSYCLSFLNEAFENYWISEDVYFEQLLGGIERNRFLFERFAFLRHPEDAGNFSLYLSTLDSPYVANRLAQGQYITSLEQKDVNGLTVMHQMVDAPHTGIAVNFLRWVRRNTLHLLPVEQQRLLSLESDRDGCVPMRHQGRFDVRLVNDMLDEMRCISEHEIAEEKAAVRLVVNMDKADLSRLITTKGFFATIDEAIELSKEETPTSNTPTTVSRLPAWSPVQFA
ncbi:MAG: hypothetical protein K0U37_05900 [Gammaproteobacteria bacterium]|nr:hypothetical protein [Gammaproteobacteria bacterium]